MRLDLVVGPNGAGKTTFVELVLLPGRPGAPFVNADLIAARRWPQEPQAHAYEAAGVAERTRGALLARREAFIAETVFSHSSKLGLVDAANAVGYQTALHVMLVPEEVSVQRVAHRVGAGGHAVPEQKVRERYARLWPLVAQAVVRCDSATVWDNSRWDGPQQVALFIGGAVVGACAWPTWTPPALAGLTR